MLIPSFFSLFFILVQCMVSVGIKLIYEIFEFITLACGNGVRGGEVLSILRVGASTLSDGFSSSSSLMSFNDDALADETNDTLAGDAGHPLSSFKRLPVRNFCGNFGLTKKAIFQVCYMLLIRLRACVQGLISMYMKYI